MADHQSRGASSSARATQRHPPALLLLSDLLLTMTQALGGQYKSDVLDEILDGAMLDQWKQRAQDVKSAGAAPCAWPMRSNCMALVSNLRCLAVPQAGSGSTTWWA
eukprot:scaffold2418_cov296-Prasinococcus_capsulatus_cf.AAC.7